MAKEKRPYGTPRIEIRNGYKYAECGTSSGGMYPGSFRAGIYARKLPEMGKEQER